MLAYNNLPTKSLTSLPEAERGLGWVLPPLSNSWIRNIIWSYIALNRTRNIDCYWVGAVPKVQGLASQSQRLRPKISKRTARFEVRLLRSQSSLSYPRRPHQHCKPCTFYTSETTPHIPKETYVCPPPYPPKKDLHTPRIPIARKAQYALILNTPHIRLGSLTCFKACSFMQGYGASLVHWPCISGTSS